MSLTSICRSCTLTDVHLRVSRATELVSTIWSPTDRYSQIGERAVGDSGARRGGKEAQLGRPQIPKAEIPESCAGGVYPALPGWHPEGGSSAPGRRAPRQRHVYA